MSARRRRPARSERTLAYLLFGGAGLILLGLALLIAWLPDLVGRPDAPAQGGGGATPAPATAEARTITATLFYVATDGLALVPVSRDVPYGATPAEQARRIADAQLQPPPEGLRSAIPDGTIVRSVYLTPRGEAFVDVSRQMITGHSGGSLNEALAVFAIVNAMVVNLPDVSAVQILVDGQEVDSITGHLDLRYPLRRSTEWVRKGQ